MGSNLWISNKECDKDLVNIISLNDEGKGFQEKITGGKIFDRIIPLKPAGSSTG